MEIRERLEELIDSELAMLGYELVKLEASFATRRKLLRIFIDRVDRPVTIDDCVEVTKAIGFVLDSEDILPGPYTLEVSSPGVERPLVKPEHFRRFVGNLARVEYLDDTKEKRKVTGSIVEADETAVSIKFNDDVLKIEYHNILKANLKPEDITFGKKKKRG